MWVHHSHICIAGMSSSLAARVLLTLVSWGDFRFSWWRDVAPCSHIEVDWHFRGAYCVHYQGTSTWLHGGTSQKTLNFVSRGLAEFITWVWICFWFNFFTVVHDCFGLSFKWTNETVIQLMPPVGLGVTYTTVEMANEWVIWYGMSIEE
jgi:hypothetical protein